MCSYLLGGWRRGYECGKYRLCAVGGLVGTTVPIYKGKIVLICSAVVVV